MTEIQMAQNINLVFGPIISGVVCYTCTTCKDP